MTTFLSEDDPLKQLKSYDLGEDELKRLKLNDSTFS